LSDRDSHILITCKSDQTSQLFSQHSSLYLNVLITDAVIRPCDGHVGWQW